MRKKILAVVLMLCLGGISTAMAQHKVKDSIFDQMLQKLLTHNVNELGPTDILPLEDVLLLDAREKEEYNVSHIKGALWVGYDDFKKTRLKAIPKNKKIVVYCSVGYRSEKITQKLLKAGYTDVSNLYGGIFEWVNQGHQVENKEGATANVHTFDETWAKWLLVGNKIYKTEKP
ncbi:rhodanese-like domain-containing protein [Spongiimicrobium salis]|uniref:rhodanese-like domain-containing protein n=1 Tax=Spongiimicrobium salis TaxID=1667022 RepID=UPI00374DD746